jgi:hypothetical protein
MTTTEKEVAIEVAPAAKEAAEEAAEAEGAEAVAVEEKAPLLVDGHAPEEAQGLVKGLMDLGLSPQEISDGVDGRVSMRTIYRWAKGESVPQNIPSFQALIDLATARGVA